MDGPFHWRKKFVTQDLVSDAALWSFDDRPRATQQPSLQFLTGVRNAHGNVKQRRIHQEAIAMAKYGKNFTSKRNEEDMSQRCTPDLR